MSEKLQLTKDIVILKTGLQIIYDQIEKTENEIKVADGQVKDEVSENADEKKYLENRIVEIKTIINNIKKDLEKLRGEVFSVGRGYREEKSNIRGLMAPFTDDWNRKLFKKYFAKNF